MNILLTGASSFTGYWFAKELAAAGNSILATLRGVEGSYTGVRGERVRNLASCAEIAYDCLFGGPEFLDVVRSRHFDVLCHHAAHVGDYRNPRFDVVHALGENTRELPRTLKLLKSNGLQGVTLTGSVFEADEGAGTAPLRAFSPYGVSKGLTAALTSYWCTNLDIPLRKFVIPNPFGPLEERRFCWYLVSTWRSGEVAQIRTPRYIRDNIHVSLLAKKYASFIRTIPGGPPFKRTNPSGYVESQGAFAQRFAAEIGPRLGLDAGIELLEQVDFSEPLVRINTDPAVGSEAGWSEKQAWDDLAAFYQKA